MNARQKAKKYKCMYEKLLYRPIRFKEEQYNIDTLKFRRFYPTEFLLSKENSNYFREIMVRDIARDIATNLDKYVDYNTEFYPDMQEYCLYGEIKIVNRL